MTKQSSGYHTQEGEWGEGLRLRLCLWSRNTAGEQESSLKNKQTASTPIPRSPTGASHRTNSTGNQSKMFHQSGHASKPPGV